MARLSAKSLRYGAYGDNNLRIVDLETLPPTKKVHHTTASIFMQGKGGTKKNDMLVKNKIYNYYAVNCNNPFTFSEFWGIKKEFYEII